MDNELQTKTGGEESKVSKKQRWFAGYIIAGIIFTLAQNGGFDKTPLDGLIILVIAVLAGVFYHRLKEKIKIKTEGVRIVVTFLVLEIIAGALIGLFTALI
jgi:hypothetical protein